MRFCAALAPTQGVYREGELHEHGRPMQAYAAGEAREKSRRRGSAAVAAARTDRRLSLRDDRDSSGILSLERG